jgi:hypothetical protein
MPAQARLRRAPTTQPRLRLCAADAGGGRTLAIDVSRTLDVAFHFA